MASNPKKKEAQAASETIEEGTEETITVSKSDLKDMISASIAEILSAKQKEIDDLTKQLDEEKKSHASVTHVIPSTDVTLVYMSDSPGILNKVPNLELYCSRFGEEFVLSRSQFDAVVGAYRKWFDEGILAVSHRNLEVAAAKGLRTDDEFALKPSQLQRLGTMPLTELVSLWNECSDKEKLSIVTYYKRKFIEGKEPGYRAVDRVLQMNTLTNQGLKREAIEISGASLKIAPVDFMSI